MGRRPKEESEVKQELETKDWSYVGLPEEASETRVTKHARLRTAIKNLQPGQSLKFPKSYTFRDLNSFRVTVYSLARQVGKRVKLIKLDNDYFVFLKPEENGNGGETCLKK